MPHAITMLRDDHRRVQQLFEEFEKSEDDASKREIAQKAIRELDIHAALEEEVFYPAAREQLEEPSLIDEALEEHHVVKLLANELKKLRGGIDERFEAKFKVMAESTKHHIREEEGELFPQIEGKIDAEELGQRLSERKQKLESQSPGRTARGRMRPSKPRTRKTGAKKRRARTAASKR